MQQIIRLGADEDIAAIRARIETSDLSHIVFVVPRTCPALETDRGLQLLRRAAEDAGVEIAFVVHNPTIREHATAFGFPLFSSVDEAQRVLWQMELLGRDLVQGAPKRQAGASSDGSGILPSNPYRQWWSLVIIGVVFSCMLCLVATLFVPAANVRILPSTVVLSATTGLVADPSITATDSETRSVPARRITHEISGSASLKTTKEQSVPNAPSTGKVIFTNVRGEQFEIPMGTIVETSAGVPIRFTTTETATMPAGVNSRVTVPIQAVDPGPTGNVKELAINTIEGSLNLEARVINLQATASGSLKPVKVVTADDKKKLEEQLLEQLRQQAGGVLEPELKPGEFLPTDSVLVDVDNEVFDHTVDDPAEVLNLRITATAYGLGVDQQDCVALVQSMLEDEMQKGYQLLPDGVRVDAIPGGKYKGIALQMPIKATGYSTPQIDTGKLAVALQGKTGDEAAAYLSRAFALARPPEINITPMGWNRMPWLGFRIAVFVEPPPVSSK